MQLQLLINNFQRTEHDVAETVKVSVSAVRAAHAKIKPFQMSFLTPFQMICSLLPDTGAVHSATALARCLKLPHSNVTVSVLDDELTALCQRTSVPDDLAFKPFFGGLLTQIVLWTLLVLLQPQMFFT